MRRELVAAAAAVALVGAACAPEAMTTQAAPAKHTAPSVISAPVSPEPTGGSSAAEAQPELTAQERSDAEAADGLQAPSVPGAPLPDEADEVEAAEAVEPGSSQTPDPRPAATATPTAPAPDSRWRDVSVPDVAYSQVGALLKVSPSFRDYAEQAMSAPDTDGCTVLSIGVMSDHPAGFVVGSISTDCGGGQAIWAEQDDGKWRCLMVLQAPPLCPDLVSIGLPGGVGLLCDDGHGQLSEY